MRRRTPRAQPPLAISRRRIYILPTRSGGIFGLLLLVMLLGATNYSNSLGFALTFWLAAIALVSMHHAHRNLVGLRIAGVSAKPAFAGARVQFDISMDSHARRARRAVRISAPEIASDSDTLIARITTDAPERAEIVFAAEQRGRLACPRLRVESVFPLGLFRAWSWLAPDAHTLIYPRPVGHRVLPQAIGTDDERQALESRRGAEEFVGYRPYIRGDSPREIDWKASARTDDLLVHEHAQRAARTLWLDYEATGTRDREARLSQLARWVIDAERAGLVYGLRLPGERIAPAQGNRHRENCLAALALL